MNETQEQPKKPDWDIGEIYRAAWQITKKYKVLWLFGMAMGAGGYSSNSSSRWDQKDIDGFQKLFQNSPHSSNSDLSMVLGAATNSFSDSIASLFAAVPAYYYVIAAIELIVLLCAGIIISVIYRSWAEASLLEGIQIAITNGNVNIRETSEKAIRSIKDIALVRIVPIALIVAAFFLLLLVMVLPLMGPLRGLVTFVGVIFFIFSFIMISFSQTWAVRKIVIEKLSAKQAFREGYNITTRKFWSMVLLGFLNTCISALITFVIAIPIIILGVVGFLMLQSDTSMGITLITIGVIVFFVYVTAITFIEGITNAFKNSVWSLAYQKIKGKYDK